MEKLTDILISIAVISFLIKFLLHLYLGFKEKGRFEGTPPGYFSMHYILPYKAEVEEREIRLKTACNILLVISIISLVLFIIAKLFLAF